MVTPSRSEECITNKEYAGLRGCSREKPYRDNTLIIKSVGMLPGASAEYSSLSINVQYKKIQAASIFLIQPVFDSGRSNITYPG